MGKMNWVRVLLCGVLTGGIWYLLALLVFVFALGETEFVTAVEATARPTFAGPLSFFLHLGLGIWTIWLYAAIRPRFGPGPKTAVLTGFALWIVGVLVDAMKFSMGFIPLPIGALLAPVAAGLPIIVLATVAGAWLYQED